MSLSDAVKKTIHYSKSFGLPITQNKIHHWLITSTVVSAKKMSPYLPKLTKSESLLIEQRFITSQKKIAKARRIAKIMTIFPTIKLICITGSVAADNAKENDDLDLMLVTTINTLWLTRPFLIFFLKVLGLRRGNNIADKVCDNLWLDESALSVPGPKRGLYTAHEVLQVKPIFDRDNIYARFILSNSWVSKYLANAYQSVTKSLPKTADSPRILNPKSKILNQFNNIAFKLQYLYMKKKITRETITLHSAYFHPKDYGLMNTDG